MLFIVVVDCGCGRAYLGEAQILLYGIDPSVYGHKVSCYILCLRLFGFQIHRRHLRAKL